LSSHTSFAAAIAIGSIASLLITTATLAAEPEVHVSLAGGVSQPWDGDWGHSVTLSAQVALERRRMWIGLEIEQRSFSAQLTDSFEPDYDSVIVRGLFHFHPLPDARISPYAGLGVGIALHVVDRYGDVDGVRTRRRDRISGGSSFLALLGVQAPIPVSERLSVYAEGRLESLTDLWKKRGSTLQYDQVGAVTGMVGLRFRF
jgi:hypothetical protein